MPIALDLAAAEAVGGLVLASHGDAAEGEALLRQDPHDRVASGLIDGNTFWNLWRLATAAAWLFSGAVPLYESTGFPVASADRAAFEADIAVVRATLGNRALAEAWSDGTALAGSDDIFVFAFTE